MLRAAGYNCNCDICDRFLHLPAPSEARARAYLKRHGWESGDLDLCKTCIEKRDQGVDGILLLIEQRKVERSTQPDGASG